MHRAVDDHGSSLPEALRDPGMVPIQFTESGQQVWCADLHDSSARRHLPQVLGYLDRRHGSPTFDQGTQPRR